MVEEAGSNFAAYLPDVPGCIATGATVEDTLREIADARDFHFDGLRLAGLPIPEARTIVDRVPAVA